MRPLISHILVICASLFWASTVFAQHGTITGQLTTSDGQPAGFVSVFLKETTIGTTTNEKGEFKLSRIKAGDYILKVSAVGLQSQEKPVTVKAGQATTINLVLGESAEQLQEVIVQGDRANVFSSRQSEYVSKMPLSRLENPQVYTSVTRELLSDQVVFSVDDAVKNVPGFQKMWDATGRAGDGGSYYNSRGFIVQSSLRNGIAGMVTNTIDAINLEKLEVIKGPSATLFGSSLTSYGGVMNRVTKKPYNKFGGELSYSTGSFQFNRGSADINIPLDNAKKILFRLNTAYQYEGSFQDNVFARTVTAAPSLSYTPTNRLTIHADAELFYGKNIGQSNYFFYFPSAALGATRADQVNIDYTKSYQGDDLFQKTRSMNFFGQVNYKISKSFTSSTNFTSSSSFSDGYGAYFYLIPDATVTLDPADAGKANYLARADQSTGDSKSELLEIQQNFNGDFKIGSFRNRMVVGLDFLRHNSNQNFFGSVYDIVPLNVPDFDYSTFNNANMTAKYAAGAPDFTYPIVYKINTYSAFVSDVLNLTDQLSVLAALRVDHYDNKGGVEGGPVAAYAQTAFSPKFGLVFQPVLNKVSLFANYQNSFTNLGAYGKYDITAADSIRQEIARLEQANQIEAGVKVDVLEGRLSATLSYYDIHIKDVLRTDPNPVAAVRQAKVQDGTQASKGVELELIANPVKGLNVVAGFSYNDSKFEKADADVNGLRPGTASSPYLANFWVSYRLPETLVKGLGFGFGGNYASDNKVVNSRSRGEFILPSYTVLNASAFYERSRYRVSVKADNLSNERYWTGYSTMNAQKPRSFVGSVAFRF
jgi:iron complex outermembrane receptor protein